MEYPDGVFPILRAACTYGSGALAFTTCGVPGLRIPHKLELERKASGYWQPAPMSRNHH